jgi:hypothetical protein
MNTVSFPDDDAAQATTLQMMEEYIIGMQVDDDTTEEDGVNDRTPSTFNKLEIHGEAQSRNPANCSRCFQVCDERI